MATRKSEAGSLQAIQAQIAKLQEAAAELRAKEVSGVIARIRREIVEYGLTAEELGFRSRASRDPAAKKRKPGTKRMAGKSLRRNAVQAKFGDDQGNTWVGRGKRPEWFKAALAAGRKPEELLLK